MSSDKYDVLIRFNGKNYSAWAFHFKIFAKAKIYGVIFDSINMQAVLQAAVMLQSDCQTVWL